MKNSARLAFSFLIFSAAAAFGDTLWHQYGFNSAHTSYNNFETALSPLTVGRLTIFWTSDTFKDIATAPILGSEAVFVANDGRVRSLDKRDGRQRWSRFSCSAEHTVQPALGPRILMVGDGGGDLAGYKPKTGEQIVCDDESGSILSAPMVADDTVFFTNNGESIATDQFTSRDHWRVDTGSHTTPALGNGLVFVTGNDSVYALDGVTGKRVWRYKLGAQPNLSSPSFADGIVYVGGDALYALDATDGHLLWQNNSVGVNVSTPAIAEGRVFVNSQDPSFGLFAFDATNGTFLWRNQRPEEPLSTVTVANGVVYDIADDGELMMFDASNGKFLSSVHDPDGKPFNSDVGAQAIVADGVVYVSTGDFSSPNRVDAFRLGP